MQAHGIKPIDLLVVNLYPFEETVAKGADFDDLHREHRHRRPRDDPRRRQEPRRRGGGGRRRRLCGRARRAQAAQRHDARDAQEARRQGLRPHRRLRRRDLELVRARARRHRAGVPRLRRQARQKRCATARIRTSRRRSTARREQRPGVASARQVQGKQLSYNNLNDTDAAYECVAEFDPKRTAAVAIIKHANPCGVAEGDQHPRCLQQGAALRSGLGVRRHRRAQPDARRRGGARHHRDLHRGDHRAGRHRRGDRHRRRQEEPAAPARRRPARSARQRADGEVAGRRPAGAVARQRGGRRHGPQGRHQARADQLPSSPTWRSPSASPSTSSRTPSSTPRTAPPSASAPAR